MALVITPNKLTVWVGDPDGSPVDRDNPDHLKDFLIPVRIRRGLGSGGGNNLDYAQFEYDLSKTGESVANISTPMAGYSRQLEIHVEVDESTWFPLFWGDLTHQTAEVGARASIQVAASIYPYHFGKRLMGPEYYNVPDSEPVTIVEPIEFNPVIEGRLSSNPLSNTVGNMRSLGLEEPDPNSDRYWIDPESTRTTAGEDWQNAFGEQWTLHHAVLTVCRLCNGDEEFVKNPTPDELPEGLIEEYLENVTLDQYQHLPFYLDALLHPNGYDWGIAMHEEDGVAIKTIRVIERGVGSKKLLLQQAPGDLLNIADGQSPVTNTEHWKVTIDTGNAFNAVTVVGGYKQYEATFELYRGWPTEDDALGAMRLMQDPGEDGETQFYNGKQNVWRLWVANEAGDYSGTRDTGFNQIPQWPRDWSEFGVKIDRRRKLEDCLRLDADGVRRPPFVEYTVDDGENWEPAPDSWSYEILPDQCGIYFTGNSPPEELADAPDKTKVQLRVTATITGDERLEARVTDTDGNCPNARVNEFVLPMPDVFTYRWQVRSGDYESALVTFIEGEVDNRVDDQEKAEAYAQSILNQVVSAMVEGDYRLIGSRFDYELGDLLLSISPRGVSLNRNAQGGTVSKYPQVSAIEWFPQEQVTTLITEYHEAESWYSRNSPANSRSIRGL